VRLLIDQAVGVADILDPHALSGNGS
jgi:hypothetical protein